MGLGFTVQDVGFRLRDSRVTVEGLGLRETLPNPNGGSLND